MGAGGPPGVRECAEGADVSVVRFTVGLAVEVERGRRSLPRYGPGQGRVKMGLPARLEARDGGAPRYDETEEALSRASIWVKISLNSYGFVMKRFAPISFASAWSPSWVRADRMMIGICR